MTVMVTREMSYRDELELDRLYLRLLTGDRLRDRRRGGLRRLGGDLLPPTSLPYLGGEGPLPPPAHLPGGPPRLRGGGVRRGGLATGRGGKTVWAVTS